MIAFLPCLISPLLLALSPSHLLLCCHWKRSSISSTTSPFFRTTIVRKVSLYGPIDSASYMIFNDPVRLLSPGLLQPTLNPYPGVDPRPPRGIQILKQVHPQLLPDRLQLAEILIVLPFVFYFCFDAWEN